jgi:hypothetical protein
VITHPQFHPRAQHPRRRGHDGRGSRLRQGYAALGSPPIELPRTVGLMDIPVERLRGFVEHMARLAVPEDDTRRTGGAARPLRPNRARRLASLTSPTLSPAPTTSSCARRRWRSGR